MATYRLSFAFRIWLAAAAIVCTLAHGNSLLAQTTATATATTATATATTATATATTATATATNTTTTNTTTNNITGAAGVVVDAHGVLRTELFPDVTGQLARQRIAAARAAIAASNPAASKPSPLRKVSLNRLEAAIKKAQGENRQPTEEMKYLAGLTRVQYVFYYPETKDIVIAGPAEGWVADQSGRVRGLNSGRPIVELQDVITALRAFPPAGKGTSVISCSIDPTKEGLQRMQEFVKEAHAKAGPNDGPAIVAGLKESLGPETVSIKGVNPATHFAQVLVEADYRMKLIGIGLERPQVKQMVSWIDRVHPASVAKNALQRWYFVPNYDCVKVSDDDFAMELVGDGVKLVGADEVVAPDGSRAAAKSVDAASRAFTENFTKYYGNLATVTPVYAQLRNCIDLAVAAAFIQQKDYYGKSGWTMPVFGEESTYPVQTLAAPQVVESMVNAVWHGNTLMTPIGGGVNIQPKRALEVANLLPDTDGKIGQERSKAEELKKLGKDQWWWD
jgi:hypothetical protein